MKKTVKTFILVMLTIVMCLTSISTYASENQIMPRLSHMDEASFAFVADASGGIIEATYTGYEESFLAAKLTVKVEKRFLLVFWNEVGTWSTTCTDIDGFISHTMPLNGSGKYRATFTLEVLGKDGTLDVVDMVLESDY